jgi:hypothetical protein
MKTWDTLLNGSEGDKPKELWSCRGRQQAWPGMLLESIPVRYLLCREGQHEMVLIFTSVHSPFVTAADKVRPGGTLLFMGGTGGRASASGSRRQSPLHSRPSRRTWHSSSRPSE